MTGPDEPQRIVAERQVLHDGLVALRWLSGHADQVHAGLDGGQRCVPCGRFVAAILRGAQPQAAVSLRCDEAQAYQACVDAAYRVVDSAEVTP